jgi:hypothetical protein
MTRLILFTVFILLVLGLVSVQPVLALTNGTGTVTWTPTTDATIRYELRWSHFTNGYAWLPLASNLDSTTGTYAMTFPPFADSTGDRGLCVDARAVRGTQASPWASANGAHTCTQVPLTAVVPVPPPVVPPPLPVPGGLQITKQTPGEVVIAASTVDCPRILTSTKGSTTTTLQRTVRCVQ